MGEFGPHELGRAEEPEEISEPQEPIISPEELSADLIARERMHLFAIQRLISGSTISNDEKRKKFGELDELSEFLSGSKLSRDPFFYPDEMLMTEEKENYHLEQEIESKYSNESNWKIHAIPNGDIVAGKADGSVSIFHPDLNGKSKEWSEEFVADLPENRQIYALKALPDGRIMVGYEFGSLVIYSRGKDDDWESEVIVSEIKSKRRDTRSINILSDGGIVIHRSDSSISVYKKIQDTWAEEEVSKPSGTSQTFNGIKDIQVLPDGLIVTLDSRGTVFILTRDKKGWQKELFHAKGKGSEINCSIQTFPDGRIVVSRGRQPIVIYNKAKTGWKKETVDRGREKDAAIRSLRTLPDGRIIAGTYSGLIVLYKKTTDGWQEEIIQEETGSLTDGVHAIQALPDGRFVAACGNKIRVFDGDPIE